MSVIPFYGASDPAMFGLERAAMDRDGLVVAALDRLLPGGRVLDVGAGDGFTAERIRTPDRTVIALEPSGGMVNPDRDLAWVRGDAAALPVRESTCDGAYATWAYYFPSLHPLDAAFDELDRVVRPGGLIAIANNLGEDEFAALSDRPVAEPSGPFLEAGFELEVIETAFRFESLDDARALMGFFFGDRGREGARLSVGFRVGLYFRTVP